MASATAAVNDKQPFVPRKAHFIPVPKHHILDQVLADTADPTKRDELRSLCTMVDNLYNVRSQKTLEGMKADYSRLSFRSRTDTAASSDPDTESRFFKRIMEAVRRANFVPMSKAEADSAAEVDYLFALPVEVSYSQLQSIDKYKHLLTDAAMFPSMAHGAAAPDFSDHFFIFHRGLSIDRRTDHFIWNKLDLLLSILEDRVTKLIFRSSQSETNIKTTSSDGMVVLSSLSSPLKSASASLRSFEHIERINLVDTFNRRASLIGWLLQEVTVQEPSYERLILVYREAGRASSDSIGIASSVSLPSPRRRPSVAMGVLNDHDSKSASGPVRIKLFRDVPMADLELVYPEKSVKLNLADKLKLWVSIGLAFLAVFWEMLTPGEHGFSFSAVVISIVLYAVRCYLSFQSQMDVYASVVNESLYQKSLDTDQGVLIVLIDAVEDQEFSEVLLAYHFLWLNGRMTARHLKRACQEFLHRHWHVKASFEVHDALRKLEELRLVEVSAVTESLEDANTPVSDDEDFDVHSPQDSHSSMVYSVLEPSRAVPILREAWMAAANQ